MSVAQADEQFVNVSKGASFLALGARRPLSVTLVLIAWVTQCGVLEALYFHTMNIRQEENRRRFIFLQQQVEVGVLSIDGNQPKQIKFELPWAVPNMPLK